ncbi:MAG: DUF3999 domain-containing protein [Kiritimatiellae bacterium]|nr:DUF3999 domain-containing protein [Kiritimatiellia bacterium]
MRERTTLVFAVALAVSAAVAADSWPIVGEVREECVAAVELKPFLHFRAGEPGALADRLRIRDASGAAVPYAVKRAEIRKTSTRLAWHALKVERVAEADGKLVVEVAWPAAEKPVARFASMRVDTPLRNFEQTVSVSAGGDTLATGDLCDYAKHADFRKTEFAFDAPFRGKLTLTFAKPSTEVEAARFERTLGAGAGGKLETRSVRRGVEDRPFRVDGVSVAERVPVVSFEPAPVGELSVAARAEVDAKAKTTRFSFALHGVPVTAVRLNVKDRNFSRTVNVYALKPEGWRKIGSAGVHAIDLPGEKSSRLEVPLGGEWREKALRVEVEDNDNPPLGYAELPTTLLYAPYDALFIAKPGEAYAASLAAGEKRPRYDEKILDYVKRVRDPLRLVIDADEPLDASEPTSVWLAGVDPVAMASVLAFLVLGFLCWRLVVRKK